MAISQMQKLSLVFPKANLDKLLWALQKMQGVEIRDLQELPDWQSALDQEQLELITSPQGQELQEMQVYQKELESVIAQLNQHLPQKSLFKTLKEPRKTLTFEELEAFGQQGQGDATLTQVREQLQTLKGLDEKIQACQDKINVLDKWRSLEVTPKKLREFRFVKARVGSIPSSNQDSFIKAIESNPDLAFEKVYNSETEYGLIVLSSAEVADLTGELFDKYAFKPFLYDRLDLPREYSSILVGEQEMYDRERRQVLQNLQTAYESLDNLHLQIDYHLSQQARLDSKALLANTTNLTALEGWVEVEQLPNLRHHLQKALGHTVFMTLSDVTEEDWEQTPIKLNNNAFVEPFELVTEMYSLPKYQEKDPTPFLAPFYFTFFGMMVADLGYGLVLFVATALALKLFFLDKGTARFLRFFNYLAISVALWGLVYGSFFGFELPFHLLSTSSDVISILALSVVFGFVTLIFGLILGGLQKVRVKEYTAAYHSGFAWVMILTGLALLVVGKMLPSWAFLSNIGSVLAILNALGILVVSIVESKGLGGLGSGLFNLYNISSYVGDLVSFTRLMALGLSGASIGSAFNTIVGIFPTWARFSIGIFVFLLLHLVNLLLSLLSGYVHGARLIFVEFFGKFYEGGGRAFAPLKPAEKFITIKKEVHLEDK